MIFGLIKEVVSGVGGYFKGKQKQKTLKQEHESKIQLLGMQTELEIAKGVSQAKIELAKTGQAQDFSLDKTAVEQMDKSWKDEFLMIVFIVPMIMAFIPSMQELALKGFEVIKKMPDWYVAVIIGMFIVIYGLRGLFKWFMQNKINLFKKD